MSDDVIYPTMVIKRQAETIKLQEKEIERLNNIIEEYKNANEYHQNIIHELETIKQPNQLYGENVILRAENNRLNNIINELEKYIKVDLYHVIPTWRLDTQYAFGESTIYEYILNKIKKLKENTK